LSAVGLGTAVICARIGAVLSIRETVAVAVPVFPAMSVKLNIYDPLPVNV